MASENPNLECRFYENKFPEVDDLVVVNVRSIAEMGAYVSLLEYDNIEGMILLSELSRRRIRSINKLIRVGRNEVVVVLRVDQEKGYIDLSKRRVAPEDMAKCEEKYNKAKAVHSIMRHVAYLCKYNVEFLYETIAWPLAKRYGDAYEAFKQSILNPTDVFEGISFPNDAVKQELVNNITRRLTPQSIRLRADIEVTCFTYGGIESIKEALHAAVALSTEENPIKVKLDATPLYVVTTTALDKANGVAALETAIEAIAAKMQELGGSCTVKNPPFAVADRDDYASVESELDDNL
eukprot:TRINITY_DN809_c0_g1_i1.p1 TRINITY_DN809_c0_g1~~TRINITY_DN809_c0_g1_i1.p1  ORF type:complete len:294 (-),score=108.53 TRINITY_DN809_c0_g1_i1:129-1010(-)